MEEKSHIPLLSELTKRLSSSPFGNPPDQLIVSGASGSPDLIGTMLYKTKEIGIMQVFLPEGNILPQHKHNVKEWLICFHGRIKLSIAGNINIMVPGSCCFLPEGTSHESIALEDSKTIVVTIPTEQEFPDV